MWWFCALVLLLPSVLAEQSPEESLDSQWEQWKKIHNKQYNSKAEELQRRHIWEKSLKYITDHNLEYSQGKHTYTMGLNQFSDLTKDEMARMTGFRVPCSRGRYRGRGRPCAPFSHLRKKKPCYRNKLHCRMRRRGRK